jgi:periplasmic protein TonB
MFEQSVVIRRGRPWTMAVSLTLQCAVVAAILLWSIVHIEALGPISIPDPLPPFPRGAAVKIIDVKRASTPVSAKSIAVQPKPFIAPKQIPSAAVALAPVFEAPAAGAPGGGIGATEGVNNPIGEAGGVLPRGIVPVMPARVEPPRTPPPAEAPRRVGGDVLEARILNRVIPEYPALARQMRVSGIVQLLAVIGRDGQVRSLEIVSGHPLLVKSALEAVRQWRYSPTLLNKEPVEVMAPITVNFTLGR